MIDINGMAHVILTVSQYDKAKAFYARLLPAKGLECVFGGSDMTYFVGARTALGIQPCKSEFAGARFEQGRVGLHHICFRARSRDAVDTSAGRPLGARLLLRAVRGSRRHPCRSQPCAGPGCPGGRRRI